MVSVQEVKPETLQKLASLAEASGFRSIDDYVAAILTNGKNAVTTIEKAQRWEALVATHQISVSQEVDVSRNSMYIREDEVL